MNPLGIHAAVWVGGWSPEQTRHALAKSAETGYDLIELTANDPSAIDADLVRGLLARHGLRAAASLGLTFDADVNNEDPEVVRRGLVTLHSALDLVRAVGGEYLVGALHTTLGKYPAPATTRARANAAAAIWELSERAAELGVRIGLEVVNRYETNLFNTAAHALEFLDEVDHPNALVHLDTYHANIEEGDFERPVRAAGDRLGYVHVGESHRGFLGSGTVDWPRFYRALVDTGYTGPITFESFSSAVVDPNLSNTLAVWRDLWDDGDALARHARRHVQDGLRSARA